MPTANCTNSKTTSLWRVAELIGVDRRDRVLERQKAQRDAPERDRRRSDDD